MKNKKGFTLIELLAVIVILGLLMAIAIPSVTKYITESRKKTVVSTIGNYMTAMVNEVNDLTYTFTEANTIYAVPIECIALERGGTNPFGAWHQANNAYWAYVLVQYDDETSSYRYGYTFKDSAGYGLYPTAQSKLNEQGKQIQTGLSLKKPRSGKVTNITSINNWNGFNIDSTTELQVLVAELEGNVGNGETTCTLQQKGDNYEQVNYQETDKSKTDSELPILMKTTQTSTTAFWKYRDKIKNITFEDKINIPSNISEEYKWDVSSARNGKVMAYITPNNDDSSYYDLYIQGEGRIYANKDSSNLFYRFENVDSINNMSVLNTSRTTNMKYMFYYVGDKSTVLTLDLGDNFDTSNVTNMSGMFASSHLVNNKVFTLELGDKFDTSNVTTMSSMFSNTGYRSLVFTLELGDKFDTSNVTTMSNMFFRTGTDSPIFELDLGEKFDTSKVTSMNRLFTNVGYSNPNFTFDLGYKFDTSNVTDMALMFSGTGQSSAVFTLDLGEKFDTSNVTDMSSMFYYTGCSSTIFTLDLGNKFDTSKVTDMSNMFTRTGGNSTVFTLDLDDKFDTSNVIDMSYMFSYTGYKSDKFKLDCSNWIVDKVTAHNNFNTAVTTKVTPPQWKN